MNTKGVWGKYPFRRGFVAGLVAGIVATGVMLWINASFGGVSLPEVVGSVFTFLLPPLWFAFLHQLIGAEAKHYLFSGILVGQCLVFALSGAVFYQWVTRLGQRLLWYHGLLLSLILWLLTGFLFLPLTGVGIFGVHLHSGVGMNMLSLAIVAAVFGVIYVLLQNWLTIHSSRDDAAGQLPDPSHQSSGRKVAPSSQSQGNLSRRTIVKQAAVVLGVGLGGVGLWRFLSRGVRTTKVAVVHVLQHYIPKVVPPPRPNYGDVQPTGTLSAEITPNDQYYLVTKNLFADPTIDAGTWQLTIDGQVEHPFTLTYQELLAQPMQRQYESMMCISNEVGGEYMSNALWEGVPLKDLLQRAGIKTGVTKVVLHAADDYSDSIHLTKALESTTLLAVHMNGVPLPQEHGFPARLLVPGIYGLKHCKWITRIEVVNYDYQGYWQQRGWSDAAAVRLTARIDTPLDGSTIPAHRRTLIAGVAFSGNKGISEVDVSTDANTSWQRATLKRPLSGLTWVLWEMAWQPARGTSIISVRAIDLEGNVQSPHIENPLPNGSSGYHTIIITAS